MRRGGVLSLLFCCHFSPVFPSPTLRMRVSGRRFFRFPTSSILRGDKEPVAFVLLCAEINQSIHPF